MPEEIEEILDIKKDDIETLSLEETLKLKNIYRYPRIIGGILQGSEAIIGTGNYILRFKGDTGLWLGNANFDNAPFRVNMEGDVVANSAELITGNFQRNDFHWFTVFESIDGYYKGVTETGAVTIYTTHVTLETGATLNSTAQLVKALDYPYYFNFTWDKKREFKTRIFFNNITAQEIWIIMGEGGDSGNTLNHIGFKIIDDILYGTSGNETAESWDNLGTISATTAYDLKAVLDPGVSVKFYVNEVEKGSVISNLPTGTTRANIFIKLYIKNTEAVNKTIHISMWDFWQST